MKSYQRKDDVTLRELELVKVQRTLTRLKHALRADRELNNAIPAIVEKHRKAIGQGKMLQISEISVSEDDLSAED